MQTSLSRGIAAFPRQMARSAAVGEVWDYWRRQSMLRSFTVFSVPRDVADIYDEHREMLQLLNRIVLRPYILAHLLRLGGSERQMRPSCCIDGG
jgi:hypothetical protein